MLLPAVLLTTLITLTLSSPNPLPHPNALLPRQSPPACPTCTPNPPNNICNAGTTSCTAINTHTYCACRAGYRATTGARPGDTSVQWRLTTLGQEGRVFVAPGATCGTLCDQWWLGKDGCAEVGLRADCA